MLPPDPATQLFETQRPRLLRLGYRMLGSLSEAEDVVQDAWLRWSAVGTQVDVPAAYLTRVVSRLCLDRMKSARHRRESYVGAWLPEPLLDDSDDASADDLTLTLMIALERLSPLERAAFLLHDIFGVAMDDVATTLGRDATAVRQLAVRARRHVRDARPRFPVAQAEADRIAQAFFVASRDGDAEALRAMLAEDVVIHSDGGGRVIAFRNPIRGVDRVLRLFAGLQRKPIYRPVMLRALHIDGLPGYASVDRGGVFQTTALDIADDKIVALYIVRNPDKLRHIAGVMADEGLLPGGAG
ncbi:sigma-70 family RNA polymerase sigma factor [Sphingomonas sp. AR_OL41]|uniref:sigma-70 family RNA polymerase sigma factor n=1 Tax=Sphingomonas sp. AR_OL41 TaxID=3042729 RepID=UPI002480C6DE|nr:sigma-70 family RNA polymerase sigma factor [Sphingomonas sp. AR_OL41]MDH7974225.1 sigma-70 family RNA polymerase sigma factor [Sphingomonas sp. AR_OL41]